MSGWPPPRISGTDAVIRELRELRRTIAAAAIIATGKPISDRWATDYRAARQRLQQDLIVVHDIPEAKREAPDPDNLNFRSVADWLLGEERPEE